VANPRTIARLESRILERAAYCVEFELRDPRAGQITLTRVKLTSDLASGKIFYSVLGTEADKSKAAHMLASAAGFIQRKVARVLEMRRVPHLTWVFDDSIEEAARVDSAIRAALERDRRIQAEGAAPEPEGDEGEDDADDADDGDDGDGFEQPDPAPPREA
jgi:ribosome-binding factor A